MDKNINIQQQTISLDEISQGFAGGGNNIILVIEPENLQINEDGYLEIIGGFESFKELEQVRVEGVDGEFGVPTVAKIPEEENKSFENVQQEESKVTPKKVLKPTRKVRKKRKATSRLEAEPSSKRTHYVCDFCHANYTSLILLNRHKKEHILEKPYQCPSCPKSFNFHENLELHAIVHDETVKSCTKCNISFKRLASLHGHIQSHFRSEFFHCNYCDEILNTRQFLKLHLDKFHALEMNNARQRMAWKIKPPLRKVKKILKCSECAKIFQKQSHLVRHMRTHNGERPYQCKLCPDRFTQKNSLGIHMLRHSGVKPYKCPHCFLRFSQNGNLRIHIQRVHLLLEEENVVRYPCTQCSCVFRKLGTLNRHITENHSKIRVTNSKSDDQIDFIKIMNQIASIQTATSSADDQGSEKRSIIALADHSADGQVVHRNVEEVIHAGKRLLVCSFCPRQFTRPSDLLRHIRIHTKEKPFECSLCKRKFALKNALTSHIKTHENNLRKFACAVCDKKFIDIQSLEAHAPEHGDGYVFQCYACKMQFGTGDELKSHAKLHMRKKVEKKSSAQDDIDVKFEDPLLITKDGFVPALNIKTSVLTGPTQDRPHACQICQSSFRKISHLKQHALSHSGHRPFPCKYCDKAFKSSNTLMLHIRGHLGQKPWSCPHCNIRFISEPILKRHLLSHSKERKYLCPYCQKTFKSAVSCRRHIKIHKAKIIEKIQNDLNETIITLKHEGSGEIIPEDTQFVILPPDFIFNSEDMGSVVNPVNVVILDAAPSDETIKDATAYLALNNILPPATDELVESNSPPPLRPLTPPPQTPPPVVDKPPPSPSPPPPPLHPINVAERTCNICNRYFKKPIDFRRHLLTHTGERPFACQTCPKAFALLSTLRTHEKVHLNEKETFSCHVCANKFSSKSGLRVHLRIHTGDKPFKCKFCNAFFRTTGHRMSHEKVHLKNAAYKGVDPKDIVTRKSKFYNFLDYLNVNETVNK